MTVETYNPLQHKGIIVKTTGIFDIIDTVKFAIENKKTISGILPSGEKLLLSISDDPESMKEQLTPAYYCRTICMTMKNFENLMETTGSNKH